MPNKAQERSFAETAARLLGEKWELEDGAEPPDFSWKVTGEVFGLEVRQVFVDPEMTYGSALRRAEAGNIQTLRDIASAYYGAGGPPVSVQFLGSLSDASVGVVAMTMTQNLPTEIWKQNTVRLHNLKIVMTLLPVECGQYRRWKCIDDRVGWVRRASALVLQRAIDRKARRLGTYRAAYSAVDLLLVTDGGFNSGKLRVESNISLQPSGFRAVYLLNYPVEVVRVG